MLHFRLGQRDLALECFIRSVTDCIYNWSCWLSIANCIQSAEQVTFPSLVSCYRADKDAF